MSSISMPVLLALSEETPVNGEKLIRGMIAGYEASSRITRAADAGLRRRGWHSTGAAGVFGACAAAETLPGANVDPLLRAVRDLPDLPDAGRIARLMRR